MQRKFQSRFDQISRYARNIIFSYLKLKDIFPFLFMNKEMRNYALEYFREPNLKVRGADLRRIERNQVITQIIKLFPKLQSLKLISFNLNADFLQILPRTLKKLALLKCQQELILDPQFLQTIEARLSQQLQDLQIEYIENENLNHFNQETFQEQISNFARNMNQIQQLSFQLFFKGYHPYDPANLTSLFFYSFHQFSKSVKRMHFNYLVLNKMITQPNFSIESIKIEASEGSCEQNVTIFGLNDASINFLNKYCKNIKEIYITDHLNYRKFLSDSVLYELFSNHLQLKTLCLNCYGYKFQLNETLIFSAVSTLTALEKLGLASCKNVDFSNIMSIEHSLDNLRYLVLDFTDIDDDDIYAMSDLLKKLEFFSLKCCNKITQEGHLFLSQHLTNIRAANFKYCKSFDSDSLQNLLQNSKQIGKLKLGDNYLGNVDFQSILISATKLKELTFSAMNSFHEFSQECFSRFLKPELDIQRLKILHLSNNQSLTDFSILEFTKLSFPSLTFLSLERCQRLTAKSLEHIAISKLNRSITFLNFSIKGLLIRPEALKEVIRKMISLVGLDLFNSSANRTLKEQFFEVSINLIE